MFDFTLFSERILMTSYVVSVNFVLATTWKRLSPNIFNWEGSRQCELVWMSKNVSNNEVLPQYISYYACYIGKLLDLYLLLCLIVHYFLNLCSAFIGQNFALKMKVRWISHFSNSKANLNINSIFVICIYVTFGMFILLFKKWKNIGSSGLFMWSGRA